MSYTRFPTRFGKYVLLDRINSGGMAEVYRAQATDLGQYERLVAIKCMLPHLYEDEQFVTMFIDEAKLAAQLNHPNIVQIHELGRVHNRLYIAMEHIFGRDLRHVLQTARSLQMTLPLWFAAYVISETAHALDHAHHKRSPDGVPLELVHRDVSPQNVMLTYEGQVKVTDFGIARAAIRDSETQAGVIKGKVAYMAPEQVTGKAVDHRTDIFALGSVLYELVSGKPAFPGRSELSILEKIRAAAVAEIPDAPDALRAIVRRAMALEPDDRFQAASQMAEQLSSFLIAEKTIYGAKQAREVMQSLFGSEIESLLDKQREYAQVTDSDVYEDSGVHQKASSVELFESLLDEEQAGQDSTMMMVAEEDDKMTQAPAEVVEPPPVVEPDVAVSPPRRNRPILIGALAIALAIVVGILGAFLLSGSPAPARAADELTPPLARHRAVPTVAVAVEPAAPDVAEEGVAKPLAPIEVAGTATDAPPPAAAAATPTGDVEPDPGPAAPEEGSGSEAEGSDEDDALFEFGFMSVKVRGVKSARVVVDGNDLGYSPIVYHRIEIGEHIVEIMEETGSEIGRQQTLIVEVEASHTREAPLKLFVSM